MSDEVFELPMVYLEWVDSWADVSEGWSRIKSWKDFSPSKEYVPCKTIGFIAQEDDQFICVAGHCTEFQVSGLMSIPKIAVVKRIPLDMKRLEAQNQPVSVQEEKVHASSIGSAGSIVTGHGFPHGWGHGVSIGIGNWNAIPAPCGDIRFTSGEVVQQSKAAG